MKVIDVYKQYFLAECIFHDIERKGVMVCLTSTSENGHIKYEISVTFFPHKEQSDFAISYDVHKSKEIYSEKGRRSKKREQQFLQRIKNVSEELAKDMNGIIFWEKPLCEARYS